MAIQFPGQRPTVLHPPTDQDLEFAGERRILNPSNHTPTPIAPMATQQQAPGEPQRSRPPSRFDLTGLPTEIQQSMMRYMHNNHDRHEAAHSVDAIVANREQGTRHQYLHSVLGNDKILARNHSKLLKFVGIVRDLPTDDLKKLPTSLLILASTERKKSAFNADLSIENDIRKLITLTHWSARLPALDKKQISDLVKFATELDDPNLEDHLGAMISAMGSGLHMLSHNQHSSLVDTILDMSNEGISGTLKEFGQGLEHLHADLVEKLLKATLEIEDAEYKSIAISGLAEGIEALDHDQCNKIAQAALSIQEDEYKDDALASLGPHLHLFNPKIQMEMAVEALALRDTDDHQMTALDAIARVLNKVAPNEYPNLLNTLISALPTLPTQNRTNLMAACASALQPSNKENVKLLHEKLVSNALELTDDSDRAHVIGSFGTSLHALSDIGRNRLVTSAVALANADADADENTGHKAIAGLSSGLASLARDQASLMFKSILKINSEQSLSHTIRSVLQSEGAKALSPSQLDVLLIKTMEMKSEENMSAAIQGFGHVLSELTERQLNKLVVATVTLSNQSHKSSAIQGLADITGVHRNDLIKATLKLSPEQRAATLGWLAASLSEV